MDLVWTDRRNIAIHITQLFGDPKRFGSNLEASSLETRAGAMLAEKESSLLPTDPSGS